MIASATNILITGLKHLEAEGIVRETKNPENRRSYTYALTDKGRDLAPVLMEIILWSGRHDARSVAKKGTSDAAMKDPQAFEQRLKASCH